jgi:signal transduction histidine kinase
MKSVKNKLYLFYSITIIILLSFISIITIYLFQINKDNQTFESIDNTYFQVEDTLYKNDFKNIETIDSSLDLRNQFLLIFKNEKLLFTNQSKHRTNKILDEIEYYDDDDDEEHHKRKEHLNEKYEKFYDDGYIEIDDFVFSFNIIEKKDDIYEVYLGVDEKFLESSVNSIYSTIITLILVMLVVLLVIGYFLINRTIKPLKSILDELKSIENDEDLSKRLQSLKTADEFEELVNTFNKIRENIEINVENTKQFSSDASHELKTPLTVIQGQIELCKKDDISKKQLQETIKKIDIEQKKLQDIIKNFLLLSRLEKEVHKNNKSNLDCMVLDLVEANLDFLEEKNLELKLDIEDALKVKFEKRYLSIVINNLLTNAIKYTNEGSIEIKAFKSKNKTELHIKDSGIGISKKDQEKIFERFYRVDKARTTTKDGTGLGLSIVKKICDRFDTKININSKIGEGSTFILIFNS